MKHATPAPAPSGFGRALSVAFYMHDFAGGGVERMTLALASELVGRGVSVSLIVQNRRGPLVAEVPPEIRLVVLGNRGTAADIPVLAKLLRARNYDVMLSGLDHNNIALLLARRLAGAGTRIIISQHNALVEEVTTGWKYRLVPTLYRCLWRSADAVVAVSEGVAADLARAAAIPASAIRVIYNPVVGADFPARAAHPAPHPWLSDRSMPVFLFAGRLTAQKDPETLLLAMQLLLRTQPARLIILGAGELAGRLVSLAAELGISGHLYFAGFQHNPLPWMRAASALVLCSRYEGLGNVIIEALACGTPVIATDCRFGPAEILQGGKLGRLVPVGDAAALAEAMRHYADQCETVAERQARAAQFSVGACAEQHLACIEQIRRAPDRRDPALFGLRFSPLTAGGCAARILAPPLGASLQLLVTPNINHVRHLQDPAFAAAYAAAALICADGFPVALYARCRGARPCPRVTGCDIVRELMQSRELSRHRLFLIVESESTANAARTWANLRGMSRQFDVAVAEANFATDPGAQRRMADAVRAHRTTILLVTLGAPVSEVFVHRHRDVLPGCWSLCIGQALRVELGLIRRAPGAWQSACLEWAWRLVHEPRRLGPRYVKDAAWFPIAILRDLARPRGSP